MIRGPLPRTNTTRPQRRPRLATKCRLSRYATAAIDEAFKLGHSTLFAKVARGDETPENAAKAGGRRIQAYFCTAGNEGTGV